jgi:hypothetical protein
MAAAMNRPRKQLTVPRPVESLIHLIRGQKVMLDSDLADLYGVPTRPQNGPRRKICSEFAQETL